MHQYILIVCTYIWSDGISMIPNNPNTLTCQSTVTNDSPRDPLHGPVTWRWSNFKNFKEQYESCMDGFTFNWKVGRELIMSGGRLVWGTYNVKSSNYRPSWQRVITICQYTCRHRGLKVMIQIGNFLPNCFSWCDDVNFFGFTRGYLW